MRAIRNNVIRTFSDAFWKLLPADKYGWKPAAEAPAPPKIKLVDKAVLPPAPVERKGVDTFPTSAAVDPVDIAKATEPVPSIEQPVAEAAADEAIPDIFTKNESASLFPEHLPPATPKAPAPVSTIRRKKPGSLD